jgi:hypothetical protein
MGELQGGRGCGFNWTLPPGPLRIVDRGLTVPSFFPLLSPLLVFLLFFAATWLLLLCQMAPVGGKHAYMQYLRQCKQPRLRAIAFGFLRSPCHTSRSAQAHC